MCYFGANGFVYCGCFCFLGGDALRFVVFTLCLGWWLL